MGTSTQRGLFQADPYSTTKVSEDGSGLSDMPKKSIKATSLHFLGEGKLQGGKKSCNNNTIRITKKENCIIIYGPFYRETFVNEKK